MLVLSRKQDEQVVIQVNGQTVRVQVVEIGRGKVRLGISAPADVVVHREEVWDRLSLWQDDPNGPRIGRIKHGSDPL